MFLTSEETELYVVARSLTEKAFVSVAIAIRPLAKLAHATTLEKESVVMRCIVVVGEGSKGESNKKSSVCCVTSLCC